VPDGFIVPPSMTSSGESAKLAERLDALLDTREMYAVRSSAMVEDGTQHSYAGRFSTLLSVPANRVADAVLEVVARGVTDVYADRLATDTPEIAVLVQRMIRPRVAGVVFSRNPVSGMRESVIEAVQGTADDLVAGRTPPERWVRRHDAWAVRPELPVLPEEIAQRIAEDITRIERAFGHPIDAEWAWDGTLWWLQARPITTGTRPAVYSSRMARDMLPGVIPPLVWSFNGPLKSRVFLRFLEDVFGPLDIRAEDLGTLLHYRFYINIGTLSRLFADFGLPEDSLEMLAGMEKGAAMPRMPRPTARALGRLPRLIAAVLRFRRFDRDLEAALPTLWAESRAFASSLPSDGLGAEEALARLDELDRIVERTTYYHMITLMLMQMYSMRLRGALNKKGLIAEGEPLDLPVPPGSPFDVGEALDRIADLAREADGAVSTLVRSGDFASLSADPDASAFLAEFGRFLAEFGHLSDSGVNFASVPWSEQPDRVLAMVAARFDAAPRSDSATRIQDVAAYREAAPRAWQRAERFVAHRDETSALYTFSYCQTRALVRALARHLHELGALDSLDDIVYLTLDEVRRGVAGSLAPQDVRTIATRRAEEVAHARTGEPPEVVVGDVAEFVRMAGRRVYRGIPSSRGRYTGPVTVCRGMADLERISEGDVVVVPYSDASWTPLFLRAGAIVAESGGLLSHSAILARELGVPAIVSARGVLGLADASLVTVDGYEGTITVLDRTA
jgi:pyruvate,water dikinase